MPMMMCGHAANAKKGDGTPVCVICYGTPGGAGAVEVAPEPDLTGRIAQCAYNPESSRVPSDSSLPFFEHRPNHEYDRYYCGCYGWD